ncbi:MAG: NAD(P)H-hydrate epimerase [Candidatus Marinimicrobia bacterium]|nr:NAD(P)H-hydrate epimerase [Candidatus Neomarinimicrobiota bacterium]
MKSIPVKKIPVAITTEQMRVVDRLMIEEYFITLPQMMENAGRHLADLAWHMVNTNSQPKPPSKILVVCGTGNNGGGGMVAARYLSNWGCEVSIYLAGKMNRLKSTPAKQWATVKRLPLSVIATEDAGLTDRLNDAELIIDAILGYGVSGNPRGLAGSAINAIFASNRSRILALDAPSGLDTTSGIAGKPTVKASATITLALPKIGLIQSSARKYVGDLYVADIGVPPALYQKMNIEYPLLFNNQPIIRVTMDLK